MKRLQLLSLFLSLAISAALAAPDTKWQQLEQRLYASWTSKDSHLSKHEVPVTMEQKELAIAAWRGERVGVEAVVYSPVETGKLALRLSDLRKSKRKGVRAPGSKATFLGYVLTDEFRSCGKHPSDLTPYEVPDRVDNEGSKALEACTANPVWVNIEVPRNIKPGPYTTTLSIVDEATGNTLQNLILLINIIDRTLPKAHDYAFHLDFWQQPYAVSRYYGVERWSEAHFEALRPYAQMLARAGQKVVSTILFYEPWGDQSNDKFSAMVRTTKRADGTWTYDYSVFDRWVEFMASYGIDQQINCFSMVPWDMTFRYYDEAQGKDVDMKTRTSSKEYSELWSVFLQSFAEHLRAKGWLEKTCIAMDERGLQSMMEAYAVAQAAVPGIKMALAGNYHSELTTILHDYCVALGQQFPDDQRTARRQAGQPTTVYTCCTEQRPNIFSNSAPAEAAYLPLMAVACGFDGYLHWSWMNWTDSPVDDTRYRLFAPGDTYCVYPDGRSSVRFERLIEGIEACEKYRILVAEYAAAGKQDQLEELESALAAFRDFAPETTEVIAERIAKLGALLNTK